MARTPAEAMHEPDTFVGTAKYSPYSYDQFLEDMEVIFAQAPKKEHWVFTFFGPDTPGRKVIVLLDGIGRAVIVESGKILPPEDVAYEFWRAYGQA